MAKLSKSSHPLCLLRMAMHKTQTGFAEYLGIPRRNIENWETGKTNPPDYLMNLIRYKIRKDIVVVNVGDKVTLDFKSVVANLKTHELFYGKVTAVDVNETERLAFQTSKNQFYCVKSSKVTVVRKHVNKRSIVLRDSEGGRFALTYEEFNYATGFCCD